jgi:hypothetical protein
MFGVNFKVVIPAQEGMTIKKFDGLSQTKAQNLLRLNKLKPRFNLLNCPAKHWNMFKNSCC